MSNLLSRRQALQLLGLSCVLPWLPNARANTEISVIQKKPIPSSGELLPVIGMGTWRTFNIGSDRQLMDERTEVVRAFFSQGGGLIDSSPMYGSAADVMGYALAKLGQPASLFSAEKVWSPAGGTTIEQVQQLSRRWGVEQFDLMQVHNLTDWREHLAVLRELKSAGQLKYIGITTSHGRRHDDLEQIMTNETIDFVQLTYNMTHREVEKRLLPLAQDKGIAVIANRPYDGGYLIKELKRREPLPSWAKAEYGCQTWADYLLKYLVSHPAINCPIPATSRVDHLVENMQAGYGELLSDKARNRMLRHIESL